MTKNRKKFIICPNCGMEYMPGEIYFPKEFFGYQTNIIRLDKKILTFDGPDMNLEEEFICEGCNTKFRVNADISYTTEEVKDLFGKDDF